MSEEHGFSFLAQLPGFALLPQAVSTALLVTLLLACLGAWAGLQLRRAQRATPGPLIPSTQLTSLHFFDILAEQLYQLTESVIGKADTPTFFPLIGALFLFIVTCNLIGLLPGFEPPTDNFNATFALSMFVFLYYNYAGLRSHGVSYLKHFLGPVVWLAPLMLVIELASHLARPLSLALRLRGNIMGDHLVLGVFSSLVPYLLPIIFYGLGLFVAFIQAFVFCLMTMVYISLAVSHDH